VVKNKQFFTQPYNSHALFGFEQSHAFWKHVIVLNNHVQFWVHVTVQNSHMHPQFACVLTQYQFALQLGMGPNPKLGQ